MCLATHPAFFTGDSKVVPAKYRAFIGEYVEDYASLNHFAA
jgi:type I restriction enzyme, R subunit